jgi:hypothetical protein
MNVDPMNNGTISVDHISSEDNQQDENSTQNNIKLKEINKMKKSPMTPTPLYVSFFSFLSQSSFKYYIREYSWWSTHQTETAVGTFVLFTIITIIVGIIIVFLTQPKPSGMILLFNIEIISNSKERLITVNFQFLDKKFILRGVVTPPTVLK